MIKVENVEVYGIKAAMRGMRNPLNSWAKNDTVENDGKVEIGPNDLDLASKLIKAGPPHRKFLRQILVTMDVTLPMYVVQEFDTYKVNTTRNSCSFMHKGASRDFNEYDFTFEDIVALDGCSLDEQNLAIEVKDTFDKVLKTMNDLRAKYNETKDMKYFRLMRQLLPMGYNVKFTWSANYEVLLNIIRWRSFHRLQEWRDFCAIIRKECPYLDDFAKAAFEKEDLKEI